MHDHLCENAVGQDAKEALGGRKERDAAGLETEVHEKSGIEGWRRLREDDKKREKKRKSRGKGNAALRGRSSRLGC